MMFRIEGDYSYIHTNTMQEYINNSPGLKVTIGVSPSFRSTIERLENMEREWQEQKRLIDTNPAVREAYKNFQTMVALAKEPA